MLQEITHRVATLLQEKTRTGCRRRTDLRGEAQPSNAERELRAPVPGCRYELGTAHVPGCSVLLRYLWVWCGETRFKCSEHWIRYRRTAGPRPHTVDRSAPVQYSIPSGAAVLRALGLQQEGAKRSRSILAGLRFAGRLQ